MYILPFLSDQNATGIDSNTTIFHVVYKICFNICSVLLKNYIEIQLNKSCREKYFVFI